jgi:hypothetical protein
MEMISSELSTDFVDVLNMQKIPNKYTFSFIYTYPVQSIPCKKEKVEYFALTRF